MARNPKGYPVPDPIDPGQLTCLTVYIPKSAPYIGAFFAAYTAFGTWAIWARDPLKKGRLAARVWQRAIDLTTEKWERLKGECMPTITGVRANPLDPCDVQIQEDGGDWKHSFFIGDCAGKGVQGSGALRVVDGIVQQYDPCTATWKNLGPAGDVAHDNIPAGKYPTETCGNGIAAANLATVIEAAKNQMCDAIGAGIAFVQLALQIFVSITALVPGLIVIDGALEFLAVAWSYLEAHYTTVAAFDLYTYLSPVLPAYFEQDGSMTESDWQRLLARVLALRDGFSNPSDGFTALGYAYAWIKAAGPVGCVRASAAGGILTFDCAGAEWEQFFDLTVDRGPFAIVASSGVFQGRWEAGVGWVSTFVSNVAGANYQAIAIGTTFSATPLKTITTRYTLVNGALPTGVDSGTVIKINGTVEASSPSHDVGVIEHSWIGTETATSIGFEGFSGENTYPPATDPGGQIVLLSITVRGTGRNPFI